MAQTSDLQKTASTAGIAAGIGPRIHLAREAQLRILELVRTAGPRLLSPGVAVPALLFLLFTRLSDVVMPGGGLLTPNQVVTACFLLAVLRRRLGTTSTLPIKDPALAWMMGYGAAIALSSLGAQDRLSVLAALMSYTRDLLIVVVIASLVTTMADLRRCAWALVGGAALLSTAAMLHALVGNDLAGLASFNTTYLADSKIGYRFGGPVVDANDFAQMLVTATPLALYLAWIERRPMLRIAAFATVALASWSIVMTFSRGGLVALVATVGIAVAMQRAYLRRLLPVGLVVGVVALAAPALYWNRVGSLADLAARLNSVVSREQGSWTDASTREILTAGQAADDESLYGRMTVLRVGLLVFLDHPLTGVGKGNYLSVYPSYLMRVDPAYPPIPRVVHNTAVQIAADTGLLGLAAFAGAVITAVLGVRRAEAQFRRSGLQREAMLLEAIELGIYGYLVASMFLSDSYPRYLWLLIALAIVGRRVATASGSGQSRQPTDAAIVRD